MYVCHAETFEEALTEPRSNFFSDTPARQRRRRPPQSARNCKRLTSCNRHRLRTLTTIALTSSLPRASREAAWLSHRLAG